MRAKNCSQLSPTSVLSQPMTAARSSIWLLGLVHAVSGLWSPHGCMNSTPALTLTFPADALGYMRIGKGQVLLHAGATHPHARIGRMSALHYCSVITVPSCMPLALLFHSAIGCFLMCRGGCAAQLLSQPDLWTREHQHRRDDSDRPGCHHPLPHSHTQRTSV